MSAALDKLTPEEEALLGQMASDEGPLPTPDPVEPKAAEPAVAEPKTPEPEKMVAKAALDEERIKRKKLEKELNEVRAQSGAEIATVKTRLQMITEAIDASVKASPAATPEPPAPAFDADPQGFIKHEFKRINDQNAALARDLAELRTGTVQMSEQQQRAQQLQDIRAWGTAQESAFQAENPDYTDAMNHLLTARRAELQAIGVTDPGEVHNVLANDTMQLAYLSRQRGQQFGKLLYDLATAKGYAKKTASAATEVADTPGRRVSTPESAAERLLRGQENATTLGSTGGAGQGEVAINAIANMDEVAFGRMLAKVKTQGPAALRNILGH